MSYILIIEDHQASADLMKRTLETAGFKIRHSLYGLAAASIARRERPDLILIDFDLPDLDGRYMVQMLRNRLAKHGQPPPPIIAITARVSTADMQLAESLGCAAFIGKPFLPADLVKVVSGFLRSVH